MRLINGGHKNAMLFDHFLTPHPHPRGHGGGDGGGDGEERVSILPPPRGRVSILCPPGHDGRGLDVRVAADALLICSAKKRALGCVNFVIKMPA